MFKHVSYSFFYTFACISNPEWVNKLTKTENNFKTPHENNTELFNVEEKSVDGPTGILVGLIIFHASQIIFPSCAIGTILL